MTRDVFLKARKSGRTTLDEASGKALLAAFGIAVPRSVVVRDAAQAAEACAGLAAPLVVKVMSPDILHKSDVGGVALGLHGAAAVAAAIRAMQDNPAIAAARVDGFLLEEAAPPGQEVVIGGVHDHEFGPLVMVGLGGVFVEVLADVAFRICPITPLDADEMLDELKGAALLAGARGRRPASRAALIDALLKVGGAGGLLMSCAADIAEADLNPLVVSETAAVAVDARFVLR